MTTTVSKGESNEVRLESYSWPRPHRLSKANVQPLNGSGFNVESAQEVYCNKSSPKWADYSDSRKDGTSIGDGGGRT